VLRLTVPLTIASLLLGSCGPDHRHCSGPQPDFVVLLELSNRALPKDTVVKVTYGGTGTESYVLANPGSDPEVVFCNVSQADKCPAPEQGGASAAAGAGGAADEASTEVAALCCELWTGGYATLQVAAAGVADTIYKLTPNDSQCTVSQTIVLDGPDGG
jgi:hypothetical protein